MPDTKKSNNWKIEVYIQTLRGPKYTLDIEASDTIDNVIAKINAIDPLGQLDESMGLVIANSPHGFWLQRSRRVSDYGISYGVTLEVRQSSA